MPAEQEPIPSSGLGVIGFNTALTRHEDIITERINRGAGRGQGPRPVDGDPAACRGVLSPRTAPTSPWHSTRSPLGKGSGCRGPSPRGQGWGGPSPAPPQPLPSQSLGAGGCVGSGRGLCMGLLQPISAPMTICAPVCLWVCAHGGAWVCTEAQLHQDCVCMGACTRVSKLGVCTKRG